MSFDMPRDEPADQEEYETWEREPENFVFLPDDMAEAYESFKLCVVRRAASGWHDVPKEDVVRALTALINRCEGKTP